MLVSAKKMSSKLSKKQLNHIENLVDKAKAGNVNAFARLYKLLASSVYRFSLLKLRDQSEAQDIVSETFRRVWESIYRYQRGNFKAYLLTIARNLIYTRFKKQSKTVQRIEEIPIVDPKADVEKGVISAQESKELHQAIQKLPENYKEVIICRFIEELSIKETASVLNKTSISVRVIQHRALKKLKNLLKQ